MTIRKLISIAVSLSIASFAWAQQPSPQSPEAAPAMDAMSGAMSMGPHMFMTAPRPKQPGDDEKAAQILAAANTIMAKYQDYHTALDDGFKIFLPQLPQKQYHFTHYGNAVLNELSFDPLRPTSLLYDKLADGSYKLAGVMYTAPKRFTEDQLNQRIPLSIAAWHQHTNFCAAPKGREREYLPSAKSEAKFGLVGSITTAEACQAEGGAFKPVIFNWMVHVYPANKGHEFSMDHGHDMSSMGEQ